MSSQKQPRITTGNPLDTSETTSNVATNRAELEALKAANIDGKDTYPNTVTTKHLNADNGTFQGYMKAGSLLVGTGGVSISSDADGATPTTGLVLTGSVLQLIKSSEVQVTLDGTNGNATFKGTIAAGSTISATMTAGSIFVGSGGVSISTEAAGAEPSAAGLYMGMVGAEAQIYLKDALGAVTVRLNGSDGSAYFAGQVVTSNIQITDSASNTANLQSGTIYLGTSITVGASGSGRTLGDTARTFYQTTAPVAGMLTGDYWIDSDDLITYRYNGANWTAQTVATVNATFAQAAIPTSTAAGDFWIDTDDGNKLYRAASKGADQITAGEWVAVLDALNAGDPNLTVDANNNITNIDTTGITVGTATSGARVQINSTGVGVYDSGGVLKTWMDTNGFAVKCASDTAETYERAEFQSSNGTVNGWITSHKTANAGFAIYAQAPITIQSTLDGADIDLTPGVSGGTVNANGVLVLASGVQEAFSGTQVIYRRDDASNTPATLAYLILGDTSRYCRQYVGTLATVPTNYSLTSGGASGNWGSQGDVFFSVGGSFWLREAAAWTRVYGASVAAATAHP